MELNFKTGGKGFVAEAEGYLCWIVPTADWAGANGINWKWEITSGGGWTDRGGANVATKATGWGMSADDAERQIIAWLDTNAD